MQSISRTRPVFGELSSWGQGLGPPLVEHRQPPTALWSQVLLRLSCFPHLLLLSFFLFSFFSFALPFSEDFRLKG